jgi:hypothetical protein
MNRQDASKPTPPDWAGLNRTQLLRPLLGGWVTKGRTFGTVLSSYGRRTQTQTRLERLRERGYIQDVPNHWQLLVAGQHMMLGVLSDETRIWYEQRGIAFTFHNFRRFVDHPASMIDPVGLFLDRDTIIHHVLQSTHRHPVYDMQLLAAHEGGLEELARRIARVNEGTDEAQAQLEVLVEDPEYHQRLQKQVTEFIASPLFRAPKCDIEHVTDPIMKLAMDQFRDVWGFTSYAARLDVGRRDVLHAAGEEVYKATAGRLFTRSPVRLDLQAFDVQAP